MSKYEEVCATRAREMAEEENKHLDVDCRVEVGDFYFAARLSVAREAEAAKEALYDNNHDRPKRYVELYLSERGLIPPQTQIT